jgi:ADP-L-glycero-D-manno-heptose 6-epimerase
MASMVFQLYRQIKTEGVARLFRGTDGYADGEQQRDFVSVGDVVKANLAIAEGSIRSGIFNVGTGTARSFNDVAKAVTSRLGRGRIEYIPFPATLAGRYQSFTQADLAELREAGYREPFSTLEDGVARAVDAWERESATT